MYDNQSLRNASDGTKRSKILITEKKCGVDVLEAIIAVSEVFTILGTQKICPFSLLLHSEIV